MINSFRIAISFLTTLPFPAPPSNHPDEFGKAAKWFSLVGLCMGALLAVLGWGLALIFPPLVVGGTVTVAWVLLTGGLHLDGLADCCDGMLSSALPQRRLEIMKDPRLGAFGAMGLFLVLLMKTILISELATHQLWLPLVLSASVGRWFILPASAQPKARPGGLGEAFARGVNKRAIFLSALIPLGLVFFLGGKAWLSLIISAFIFAIVIFAARRRLGGVTGDVFGMIVELTELAILLGFSIKM
jgi:adenosylcobinamide-GDP ribazoletransferase